MLDIFFEGQCYCFSVRRQVTDESCSNLLTCSGYAANQHRIQLISEGRSDGNGPASICIHCNGCASIFHRLNDYRRCLKDCMYPAIVTSSDLVAGISGIVIVAYSTCVVTCVSGIVIVACSTCVVTCVSGIVTCVSGIIKFIRITARKPVIISACDNRFCSCVSTVENSTFNRKGVREDRSL